MGQSISILGTGWLGFPLSQHFLEIGWKVKGSTTTPDRLTQLKEEGIEPHLINIDVKDQSTKPFLQSDVLVINITSKNIDAFKRLINQIKQSAIKTVLFVSSTSVYNLDNKVVTEKSMVNQSPLSQIENLFVNQREFKTTIIRFGGLFGYDRQPGRFFKNGRIVKDPDACVNYIHRDDAILIIDNIVKQQVWNVVFNGVTDSHPTKREFYTYMTSIINSEPPVFELSEQSNYKQVSNEKVKKSLNFEFKYSKLMRYQPEKTQIK